MWIFTTLGFFSIVVDSRQPAGKRVAIRARNRGDLVALKTAYPKAGLSKVFASEFTDYPVRCYLPRERLPALLAKLGEDVEATNFKSAVALEQGPARAKVYHEVWHTLLQLERL